MMVFLKLWLICAASLNIAAFLIDTLVDLASDDPFIKIPVVHELTINSLLALIYPLTWYLLIDIEARVLAKLVSVIGFLVLLFIYWLIHNRLFKNADVDFNWGLTIVMIWIANIFINIAIAYFLI